jgi:hypothetical protein
MFRYLLRLIFGVRKLAERVGFGPCPRSTCRNHIAKNVKLTTLAHPSPLRALHTVRRGVIGVQQTVWVVS